MAGFFDTLDVFTAYNRQEWRDWLAANHASSPGIWLVSYKKGSGKARVSYEEAVEEALCFGWIDSKPNKLDDNRYKQAFTPRKPKSVWSKLNKTRIERLIADGLMTPAGQRCIDIAKENGSWTSLDAIEELIMPADLAEALAANPTARQYFEAFSKSVKKGIYYWIASARRPETRQKRVEETVRLAAENVKANQYRP
ncbi:YdeI/OmpD-associated family protein [Tellurirhabdus rosea]|uniref:YdeI/OmpD-associated family protein n=1 Tax=Tellurirhabdus rosea TaxID=2674997 RepID=UPI00224FE434|nr:YdeI/OmpD-associated family protein [Tellurirhabdus rosea]